MFSASIDNEKYLEALNTYESNIPKRNEYFLGVLKGNMDTPLNLLKAKLKLIENINSIYKTYKQKLCHDIKSKQNDITGHTDKLKEIETLFNTLNKKVTYRDKKTYCGYATLLTSLIAIALFNSALPVIPIVLITGISTAIFGSLYFYYNDKEKKHIESYQKEGQITLSESRTKFKEHNDRLTLIKNSIDKTINNMEKAKSRLKELNKITNSTVPVLFMENEKNPNIDSQEISININLNDPKKAKQTIKDLKVDAITSCKITFSHEFNEIFTQDEVDTEKKTLESMNTNIYNSKPLEETLDTFEADRSEFYLRLDLK